MKKLPDSALTIFYESEIFTKIDENMLHSLCKKVYLEENIDENRIVDLIFCKEETIKRLNCDFRKKDKVTDVLSFAFNEKDYLGEIYICVKRADEQRIEYGLTLDEEISRLFIHGLFHLQGFDHESEAERLKMEEKEKNYVDFFQDFN